ncbi:pirin family protein [Rhodococcus sp. HNM0569]|uniref:pirin family protein n=1 Tax=Rhodococcus sp. HNM0569 TaxID=2716340 RepID=UPI00146C6AB1|nr:pirin family protein [Rhodococcus sp. HNM0569]NLU84016.1 pirin family protein [Rhodococcus sp. HNM0569]
MSNLDARPDETDLAGLDPAVAAREACDATPEPPELVEPREVPLGGPRAMTVRRTLPHRRRPLVGAWCFVDHYGPDDVAGTGGMRVAGHPHTGLQTASWLFRGEIEHRDTTGVHATVRPGELNLMTAGSGIAHSEFSTADTSVLHGVQLWIALPDRSRFTAPGFEHYAPEAVDVDGVRVLVFLGSFLGHGSPVTTHTPLLGAEVASDGGRFSAPIDPAFEHGVLVDQGTASIEGTTARPGDLVYLSPGRARLAVDCEGPVRMLVLGGTPLGERIVMWWNFIGRTHDEIAEYRAQWQHARAGQASRFGDFPDAWTETLPAPALPNARLTPRG